MKKSFISLFLVTVFVASIGLLSCKKDEPAIIDVKTGKIEGFVYSKNGTALGAVKVYVQNNPSYATLSNKDGHFVMYAPVGNNKLVIQSGSGHLFMSVITVTVVENQTLILTPQQTILNQVGSLAYITGAYDKIQTIIIDSLGYTATPIQIASLDSFSNISGYQAIFLNCGKADLLDSLKYANLNNFVTNCGSIYASDWAVEYLTGDGNFKSNQLRTKGLNGPLFNQTKSCVPKIGGFITDSLLCTMKNGGSGFIDSIDIVLPALQTLLGKTKMTIHYDLGGWEVIQQLGPQFTVLLQDNTATNYGPLAVLLHYNSSCTQGGNILFTTFHNEPQSGVSPDVQKILQYFILNL